VVVRGETVVLPFSNGGSSSEILTSLGTEPMSWEFVVTYMTIGLFLVVEVNPSSYKCSFQKRLVGPPAPSIGAVDPITQLRGVDINLDHRYGLVLSPATIDNSLKYFNFQVQLQPSSIGHKRGIQTLDSEDEVEDGEVRHLRTQRIIDSAVTTPFLHQALLAGVNKTVFMRTLVPIEERREKYPSAFALGPSQENLISSSSRQWTDSRQYQLRWEWRILSRVEVGFFGTLKDVKLF